MALLYKSTSAASDQRWTGVGAQDIRYHLRSSQLTLLISMLVLGCESQSISPVLFSDEFACLPLPLLALNPNCDVNTGSRHHSSFFM